MAPVFVLWNLESANLIGDYETRAEALEIVRRVARGSGASGVEGPALRREDPAGETAVLAIGPDLLRLAEVEGVTVGALAVVSDP